MRSKLVVLLPARNAVDDLPDWFASVERFADAVIALDDGSTDDTAATLESHPLVSVLLRNPVRDSYRGWDDAANRNRLLEAVAQIGADWVFSLDADERIDCDDGAALRRLVDGEGDRSHAYLVCVFRMIDDLEHFDESHLWVGRLFPYCAGQRFPSDRLHFVALPTDIPHNRWLRSTIRVQHIGSLTKERSDARFAKYVEVDPDHTYQDSYENVARRDRPLRRWTPRLPFLPAVEHGRAMEPFDDEGLLVSAITVAQDDEDVIERAVGALLAQQCDVPVEVIVVVSGRDRIADRVRARFPDAQVVQLDKPALPGAARNAGLELARGRVVTFPGSHVELVAGSLAAYVRAHRAGWSMVGGTVLNGNRTWAGWASYFLDHASEFPRMPSATVTSAPGQCSYLRAVLDAAGPFPEELPAGEDAAVNERLFDWGYGAWREQQATFIDHSPCVTPAILVRHHFYSGRGRGRLLLAQVDSKAPAMRPFLREHLVLHVPRRVRGVNRLVLRWGTGMRLQFLRAWPLVVVAAVAHWAGLWWELAPRLRGAIRLRSDRARRGDVRTDSSSR